MKVGSLFSGIGGIELGFETEGFETVWFVEQDHYARTVLRKRFPDTKIYGDVKKIDWKAVPKVDILTGGFPCQDISNAGKRVGIKGLRSSLWSHYCRAIREIRPRYALIENVAALANKGLDVVLSNLAEIGYDAEWHVVSASSVGALHRRERLFIIAYSSYVRLSRIHEESAKVEFSKFNEVSKKTLATDDNQLLEPVLYGTGTRIPNRVDRIKCLGNAVVPQVAQVFAQAIKEIEG